MNKLNVNDYVITKNHKWVGKISAIHKSCPQTNLWLSHQAIPVKAESVRSTWYSILCISGGEIVTPASDYDLRLNTKQEPIYKPNLNYYKQQININIYLLAVHYYLISSTVIRNQYTTVLDSRCHMF
jgi:hypothetical protein